MGPKLWEVKSEIRNWNWNSWNTICTWEVWTLTLILLDQKHRFNIIIKDKILTITTGDDIKLTLIDLSRVFESLHAIDNSNCKTQHGLIDLQRSH